MSSLKKNAKGKKRLLISLIIIGVIIGVAVYFSKQSPTNIPFIGQFFPQQEEDPRLNETKEALIHQIDDLIQRETRLKEQVSELQVNAKRLEEEINVLQQLKQEHQTFLEEKEKWISGIAYEKPESYKSFFEALRPETAENIYKELKTKDKMAKEQKQFAATIGEMDSRQAAKAIETIVATDPELIQMLFLSMQRERQAAILTEMQTQKAAQVIKLISPEMN